MASGSKKRSASALRRSEPGPVVRRRSPYRSARFTDMARERGLSHPGDTLMEGGARVWGVQGGETVAGEGGALSVSRSRCRAGTATQSRLNVLLLAALLAPLIGPRIEMESAPLPRPYPRTIEIKCSSLPALKSRTDSWPQSPCGTKNRVWGFRAGILHCIRASTLLTPLSCWGCNRPPL